MSQPAYIHNTGPQGMWTAPLRFITSTALFDGHDAAINVIRRLLLEQGAEVIHLGHNRSVRDIITAAIQEDADAIAVSSYQGGHMEFFRYMLDELRRQGAGAIRLFVGGGGTITQQEARELEAAGVSRVYTSEDGLSLGLQGMVQDLISRTAEQAQPREITLRPDIHDQRAMARSLSAIEHQQQDTNNPVPQPPDPGTAACPVVGITGTGGAGKSSLMDELLGLMFNHFPGIHIACLTVDPTRHRTGGAMLGDRIRINNTRNPNLFLHSMATRRRHLATNAHLASCIAYLRPLGFDLLLVETAGTGQSDSEISELVDLPIYVMTSDFGAPSQLEKIEMLAYAGLVALNKADRQGALDALAEVRRQWRTEHQAGQLSDSETPVVATRASHFGDPGIRELFRLLCARLAALGPADNSRWSLGSKPVAAAHDNQALLPADRRQYLAEIAMQGQDMDTHIEDQAELATLAQACHMSLGRLRDPLLPEPLQPYTDDTADADPSLQQLRQAYMQALDGLSQDSLELLRRWPRQQQRHLDAEYRYRVRDQEYTGPNYFTTLSQTDLPRIALPRTRDWGEQLRFLLKENLPGSFPFTAGVFPHRRTGEDPARMFAGAGSAENTNHRFHFLARGQGAIRLSTAFDPIALYGDDPAASPDIYGRIGMSGVSVATLDDFKRLYSGFDLCRPDTSVSMTINGPGPIALACFLNSAIDQQVEKWLRNSGNWEQAEVLIKKLYRDSARPAYRGDLPPGHDGLGLGLLGISGADLVDVETYRQIRSDTLTRLRGTLQADILKEDQAQNECLFPIEFALRLMGDVQGFISDHHMHNYYSVSVSGYHIAEAGANPVTQLAFTLANGFTLVEYFLSRGMHIDEFAPHLSFFFSNGLDAEYAVIGRVARRIWAYAMRDYYKASPRSQRLKYHIQTSGRSLHTREIGLNDIRTTLQALYAINDNCNSLHTNAADEAITTPTEETVRRALAIQQIINREYGLAANENNLQGSFLIEELTDLVEAAVYLEFERISERGGVLAAMESLYQRRRIQEQSLYYEQRKNDGSLPIVGVNTFIADQGSEIDPCDAPLIRSSEEEKQAQVRDVAAFREFHSEDARAALQRLQECATSGGNIFGELLDTVQVATMGQITSALYRVAGHYRRSM
jgi:isobutyryl-CoA mutase